MCTMHRLISTGTMLLNFLRVVAVSLAGLQMARPGHSPAPVTHDGRGSASAIDRAFQYVGGLFVCMKVSDL